MDRDARRMRGDRPFLFAQVRDGVGVAEIVDFICDKAGWSRAGPREPPALARSADLGLIWAVQREGE